MGSHHEGRRGVRLHSPTVEAYRSLCEPWFLVKFWKNVWKREPFCKNIYTEWWRAFLHKELRRTDFRSFGYTESIGSKQVFYKGKALCSLVPGTSTKASAAPLIGKAAAQVQLTIYVIFSACEWRWTAWLDHTVLASFALTSEAPTAYARCILEAPLVSLRVHVSF